MSDLVLKPDSEQSGDKEIQVPTLNARSPMADALRKGQRPIVRRRFSATRQLRTSDSEFRPFRVY